MASGFSADLELMRASTLLESDPAAAAAAASALLVAQPDLTAASLLLAAACRRIGDAATAIRLLEELLPANPASPVLQLEAGRAFTAAGRGAEAVAAFERAVALDARLADAWRELAAQRFAVDDQMGGDAAYAQYTQLSPPPAQLGDAAAALAEGRLDAAAVLLQRHLQQAPQDVVALRMLASVASEYGNYLEAEQDLRRCLELAPGYADARFDLASELSVQQRHAEVLPIVERLLATAPDNTSYRCLKAQALRLHGRHGEAMALMRQIIAANPEDAKTHLLYGHVLREAGEQAAAIDAYRQALVLRPGMGEAYWSLANLKTVRFTESDRLAMEQQLARSAPLGTNRISLEFAYGKALEDAGQYAGSFEHYAHANTLRRSAIVHDPQAMTDDLRRSRALYTPEFFAARAGWGSERADPIFIVGLPRSGSTLLEQILASHSQIEGTRELPDVPSMARELVIRVSPAGGSNYPEPLAALDRRDFETLAAQYLQQTNVHRPLGRARFVDKMLGNFNHVGFIHLMFPRATIIDARRHPMACGFSCFKQFFPRGLTFSYDQEEFGRFYCEYAELMAHMDAVLPGRVYRSHYERLVTEPEQEVRRLLEHCGLPFEAGCLKFYETRRVVNTVSSEQVRRPINTDSVDHWRNYETWLGPLATALGDLVERYPAFT